LMAISAYLIKNILNILFPLYLFHSLACFFY